MKKQKYNGGKFSRAVVNYLKNLKPQTEFREMTSEYTIHEFMKSAMEKSVLVGVFPEKNPRDTLAYKEFEHLANYYS